MVQRVSFEKDEPSSRGIAKSFSLETDSFNAFDWKWDFRFYQ